MQKKSESLIRVTEAPYAGRTVYRYTVDCAVTGREIAAGWCDTEGLAQQMAERIAQDSQKPE